MPYKLLQLTLLLLLANCASKDLQKVAEVKELSETERAFDCFKLEVLKRTKPNERDRHWHVLVIYLEGTCNFELIKP